MQSAYAFSSCGVLQKQLTSPRLHGPKPTPVTQFEAQGGRSVRAGVKVAVVLDGGADGVIGAGVSTMTVPD